jgi:AraC family transcriptional regulator
MSETLGDCLRRRRIEVAAMRLVAQPSYGISYDDPSITTPGKCRYHAGVEVATHFILFGNAFKTTIPLGRYAPLRFQGTAARVGGGCTALLRDWLPSSGLQLDARPCYESYPKAGTYPPDTGVFDCEICIPVVRL